ncbi:MAG: FAD-binding and (Fe-S)-binding domain-containing protein [Candidatus Neomarinimicrobiota bacterium]
MIFPTKPIFEDHSENQILRMAYARDASIYRLMPESVSRPKNTEEIKLLLRNARLSKTPITFRAGGTSLSGQSLGNGKIVEVLNHWQKFKILNNGKSIKMQPGLNAAFANKILEPYNRKIGPDPASIKSACIGGIISNNSSGMVCGTKYNSYHTLKDLEFILPNGNRYDTANPQERLRFIENEPKLNRTILNIRKQILSNKKLISKIRNKYRIKNTIGYSMNSFIDFDDPLDIFSHLLVGAEGTLAFISSITLDTIEDPPEKGTGLIIFNSPDAASDSLKFFKNIGASAIELMDDSSLKTASYLENPPYDPQKIQQGDTGLLVEFQNNKISEIDRLLFEMRSYTEKSKLVKSIKIVKEGIERDSIWKIRKGLYPTLSSLRKSGLSIINEDFAIDSENLGPAISRLKKIFTKYNYRDGVIFGHAKEGNLHFIVSEDLEGNGIKNYEGLINDFSDMTLNEFDGSLKAEHGTGRNMAPFVESEWGGEIYDLMWKLKIATDPNNILNPDVLLSKDKTIHLKNLKLMPKVNDEIDKCIECGFCERVCPSRGYTLTPRQRIAVLREIKTEKPLNYNLKEIKHFIDSTCVTDGLCQIECPVNINTGDMVKIIRNSSKGNPWFIDKISNNFKKTTFFLKIGLKSINLISKIIGYNNVLKISSKLNKSSDGKILSLPNSKISLAKSIKIRQNNAPDLIHFPACINRVISTNNTDLSSSEYFYKIIDMAGLKVKTLDNYANYCCGMAFDSKGYINAGSSMKNDLFNEIKESSKDGEIPVVIDMSPCSTFFKKNFKVSNVYDSVEYLNKIKSKLNLNEIQEPVFVHEVCSLQKDNDSKGIFELANACSYSIEKASEGFCCGSGGDRGLKYPDLARNAINNSINGIDSNLGVSSSRTCEIALSNNLNINFISIEALVYRALKKEK